MVDIRAAGLVKSFDLEKRILDGLSFQVDSGERVGLLGRNGAGKTTVFRMLTGELEPDEGEIQIAAGRRVGLISQIPVYPAGCTVEDVLQTAFARMFRMKDEMDALALRMEQGDSSEATLRRYGELNARFEGLGGWDTETAVNKVANGLNIPQAMRAREFACLSGGEKTRVNLGRLILEDTDILLLDEPTKGLDAAFKQSFAAILSALTASGVSVLMVSHDVAFCAQYAHRCALFFDGSIVTSGAPRAFFSGNSFYTTSANRMARTLCPEAVTPEDVMTVIGGTVPPQPEPETAYQPLPPAAEETAAWKPKKLPWWRKAAAVLCGGGALAIFWHAARNTDLTRLVGGGALSQEGWRTLALYGLFIALLFGCIAAVGRRSRPLTMLPTPMQRRRLSKRTRAAALLILLCIPATLYLGFRWLGNTGYYPVAFAVLLECMAPFFLVFEGRRPQARELVLVATLCALGVAGRAAFFMLPQFKPVLALTIISGVALGGETGFLVGAVTMLASNVLFSQGPWTPFQMFAMGIIGFLAGVLFRRGWLRRSRAALCVFGAIAAVVIYGGIMNPVSALLYARTLEWKVIAAYYVTGFPVDCVHAAATVFFLWVLAEPMLEKLDRIKVKYGLVE